MKIFSRSRPGLISGILMAAIVCTLSTMGVREDISLLAAAGSIVLVLILWSLANFVVGQLRAENDVLQWQLRIERSVRLSKTRLASAYDWGNPVVREITEHDPKRPPSHVQEFWNRYPQYR